MTSRNYQSIRSIYWDTASSRKHPLTSDEILVELYLITCAQCGPSGAFITNMQAIAQYTGLTDHEGDEFKDLWGNDRIEVILRSLEGKGRIKLYRGGWVWVIGKWEFESKNPNVQKALFIELESVPITLLKEFMKLYKDTLSVTLSDTLSDRLCHTYPQTKVALDKSINRLKVKKKASNPTDVDGVRKVSHKVNQEWVKFIKEIVPDRCRDKKSLMTQYKALRLLLTNDRKLYTNSRADPQSWQEEVFAVLRWARKDKTPNAGNFCWSTNFLSIGKLRVRDADGVTKFEKMRNQFLATTAGYKFMKRIGDGVQMSDDERKEILATQKLIEDNQK